jgi:hypothetical protein
MTFVVKVHPAKKGSDNFPQFLHKLTASSHSHQPICDIHEVACHTHKVACMEVSTHDEAAGKYICSEVAADSAAAAAGQMNETELMCKSRVIRHPGATDAHISG